MDATLQASSGLGKSVSAPLSDLPPLWRAVSYVGVPAAIALFLVWTLTQSLLTGQRALSERVDHIYTTVETIQQQHEALKSELAGNRRLFRMICYNTADQDRVRRACLDD